MNESAFVILGAGGGIGSATARMLAKQGAQLVLAGRTREPVEAVAAEVGGVALTLDATDTKAVAASVDRSLVEFGRIDGIANCVGSLLLKPAHITTDEEWDDTIAINLCSAFAAVRAGARAMRDEGGSVVRVSSAAAEIGLANHEAIAAAKAGVVGLMRSAAATYVSRGIRVNAVAPGLVRTPSQRGSQQPTAPERRLLRCTLSAASASPKMWPP